MADRPKPAPETAQPAAPAVALLARKEGVALDDIRATAAALTRFGLAPMLARPHPLFSGRVWQVALGSSRFLLGTIDAELAHAEPVHAGKAAFLTVAGGEPAPPLQGPYMALCPLRLDDDPLAATLTVRHMLVVLAILAEGFAAHSLYWSPARLWSPVREFRAAIDEMGRIGLPPVLHIVAFLDDVLADGQPVVCSRGLALLHGQELVASCPDAAARRELVRRLARLAADMLVNGPLHAPAVHKGLNPGETIVLNPLAGLQGATQSLWVEIRDQT